jgi:hypothetical protein
MFDMHDRWGAVVRRSGDAGMPWGETEERAGQSGVDRSGVVGEVGPPFGGRMAGAQQFAGWVDGGVGCGDIEHVMAEHLGHQRSEYGTGGVPAAQPGPPLTPVAAGVTAHVVEQHRDVSRLSEHHVSPILLSR